MTKSEQRQLDIVKKYWRMGHPDTAALSLSALIRATRTNKNRAQLMQNAEIMGLNHNPNFII